jgi:hypothetical protein
MDIRLQRKDSTMNWQDQHEIDSAMPLAELASAVATGCECHECLRLGVWTATPVPVPEVAS